MRYTVHTSLIAMVSLVTGGTVPRHGRETSLARCKTQTRSH